MTHVSIHRCAVGILAIALVVALALSTATVPASARTFSFNSAGSMVQQPPPPDWACAMHRTPCSGSVAFRRWESLVPKASWSSIQAAPRPPASSSLRVRVSPTASRKPAVSPASV